MKILIAYICMCTTLVISMFATAYADTKPAQITSIDDATLMQVKGIEQVMKTQFDKSEAPLKVFPVSVEGDYAVAGWMQKQKGGRALLKKQAANWTILVCGGDGLRNAEVLIQTGMNASVAEALAKKVQQSESKLSKQQLKQLSLFGGVVKVEAGQQHGANTEHKAH